MDNILNITEKYYANLYDLKIKPTPAAILVHTIVSPELSTDELMFAFQDMKHEEEKGEYSITNLLKM